MTIYSYAQNFEDVLLWRALGHVERGRYVDAGAGHPVHHSVTKLFYDAGWSGANIEPLPAMVDELERRRPRDTTVHAAVADTSEESVELVVVEQWDELSTIRRSRAEELTAQGREITRVRVPVVRLDDVVAGLGPGDVHFVKIDVEGAELEVLRTLDLTRTRPWIILAEVVSGDGMTNERPGLQEHLTNAGYERVYFDGLNDFFVASEHAAQLRPAFEVPVNVTDDFVMASSTDRVVAELIGARLGMDSPVQAQELMQRVEGVLHDRIEFEQKLIEVTASADEHSSVCTLLAAREAELEAAAVVASEELAACRADASALGTELGTLRLTIDAMRQTGFERERMIAWYAAELANHRSVTARLQVENASLGAHGSHLQSRIDGLLGSSSWRLTLPVRFVRRPGAYFRKLVAR
jgi:FkbM family methyltransferase